MLGGDNQVWLAGLRFVGFAGSTVVHSVGGWVALAGVIVLGPRISRVRGMGDAGQPALSRTEDMAQRAGVLTGIAGHNKQAKPEISETAATVDQVVERLARLVGSMTTLPQRDGPPALPAR